MRVLLRAASVLFALATAFPSFPSPPVIPIVRPGRSGAASFARPAAPPRRLSSESTPSSLWPAPADLRRAGNVSWQLIGDHSAAVGADCPFTQHGAGSTLAQCQAGCVSAGPQGCTTINFALDIGDCVYRRCANPAHPALTPDGDYAVYSVTRPVLPLYGLSPASFRFSVTGAFSRTLSEALDRYAGWIFSYGAGDAGAPSELAVLEVAVREAGEGELVAGVDESYELDVAPANNSAPSTLTAATVFGALRGLETFAQLVQYDLGARRYAVAAAAVRDAPRFAHRGVLLDTSRHFLSLSALKQVVETMAWAKLNALSIHFSDDQSWPLVVASAPLLTLRSSFSNFSHVYTPVMMADLVDFARLRGVRILPELDTPSLFVRPRGSLRGADAPPRNPLTRLAPPRLASPRSRRPRSSQRIRSTPRRPSTLKITHTSAWSTRAARRCIRSSPASGATPPPCFPTCSFVSAATSFRGAGPTRRPCARGCRPRDCRASTTPTTSTFASSSA